MKSTYWVELDAERCQVLETNRGESGKILSIRIAHPDMPRSRWFIYSQAGNLYWRNTRKASDTNADGYIVKGEIASYENYD